MQAGSLVDRRISITALSTARKRTKWTVWCRSIKITSAPTHPIHQLQRSLQALQVQRTTDCANYLVQYQRNKQWTVKQCTTLQAYPLFVIVVVCISIICLAEPHSQPHVHAQCPPVNACQFIMMIRGSWGNHLIMYASRWMPPPYYTWADLHGQ